MSRKYQVVGTGGGIYLETEDLAEAREYRAWLDRDGPISDLEDERSQAARQKARPFGVWVEVHDRTQPPYTWWEPVEEEEE